MEKIVHEFETEYNVGDVVIFRRKDGTLIETFGSI